jgi:hypothetical protein
MDRACCGSFCCQEGGGLSVDDVVLRYKGRAAWSDDKGEPSADSAEPSNTAALWSAAAMFLMALRH